jgi:hypothetical protein
MSGCRRYVFLFSFFYLISCFFCVGVEVRGVGVVGGVAGRRRGEVVWRLCGW